LRPRGGANQGRRRLRIVSGLVLAAALLWVGLIVAANIGVYFKLP
jgi:hypothetical protein